jgi:hypothetical protein
MLCLNIALFCIRIYSANVIYLSFIQKAMHTVNDNLQFLHFRHLKNLNIYIFVHPIKMPPLHFGWGLNTFLSVKHFFIVYFTVHFAFEISKKNKVNQILTDSLRNLTGVVRRFRPVPPCRLAIPYKLTQYRRPFMRVRRKVRLMRLMRLMRLTLRNYIC